MEDDERDRHAKAVPAVVHSDLTVANVGTSTSDQQATADGAAAEAVLARTVEAGAPTPPEATDPSPLTAQGHSGTALALTALGIVYGDIGTSPLYALKQCFRPDSGITATPAHVLGVLSLMFWSLVLIVGIKYVLFVMRADNRGEGGVLALVALLEQRRTSTLVALGLFAGALLYGDGIITPAISVLSAVEGLSLATPALARFVVPIAMVLLFGLFSVQKRGAGRIGRYFGPIMLVFFIVIAALGSVEVMRSPGVLAAMSPTYAAAMFMEAPVRTFLLLGAIVLVVTGAEALYADMAHCGRRPIQKVWFFLVFPALVLNYFGQGALIMRDTTAIANPFYMLAPSWMLYPLVLLTTAATIIASQALITGAFSLTRQLVHLGYSPLVTIVHTSSEHGGQIYIPQVNRALMIGCLILVLVFQSSQALAPVYGVAVTGCMVITTLLLHAAMRNRWGWSRLRAGALTACFLAVDVTFAAANLFKVPGGGWFPLAVAFILFVIFTTWRAGRHLLVQHRTGKMLPLDDFLADLEKNPPNRTPGTAVFLTLDPDGVPGALLHSLEHMHSLHEQVVLFIPSAIGARLAPRAERVHVERLAQGFFRVTARYGYLESVNGAAIIDACAPYGLLTDPMKTSYIIADERLLPTGTGRLAKWRKRLFIFMDRNALSLTDFFQVPRRRVLQVGTQIEL